jgi:hypothetical protein
MAHATKHRLTIREDHAAAIGDGEIVTVRGCAVVALDRPGRLRRRLP